MSTNAATDKYSHGATIMNLIKNNKLNLISTIIAIIVIVTIVRTGENLESTFYLKIQLISVLLFLSICIAFFSEIIIGCLFCSNSYNSILNKISWAILTLLITLCSTLLYKYIDNTIESFELHWTCFIVFALVFNITTGYLRTRNGSVIILKDYSYQVFLILLILIIAGTYSFREKNGILWVNKKDNKIIPMIITPFLVKSDFWHTPVPKIPQKAIPVKISLENTDPKWKGEIFFEGFIMVDIQPKKIDWYKKIESFNPDSSIFEIRIIDKKDINTKLEKVIYERLKGEKEDFEIEIISEI